MRALAPASNERDGDGTAEAHPVTTQPQAEPAEPQGEPGGPSSAGGRTGFLRNVLANYSTALAMLLVSLVTTPVLAHNLGPQRFGVWVLIGAIIPYLELLELGFANATVTTVARHLAARDEHRVYRILNTSFYVLMVPGLLAFGAAVGLAAVLPQLVHISPGVVGQARILLLLLAFDMAVSIPGDTFGGGLIALQRFDLLNASLVTVLLLQAASWMVVIALGGNLVALGVVTVAISLAGQLSRYVMLRRLLPGLQISPRLFDRSLVRSLGGLSGWYSLRQISGAVFMAIDVIIAGVVVGVVAAGVYAVGQRLAMLVTNTLRPGVDVLFPHAAHVVGQGNREQLRSTVATGSRIAVGIAFPVCLVTAVLAHPAIRAWVGPGYAHAAIVVVLLGASTAVTSITMVGATVILGSGDPKVPTIVTALAAATRVALGVLLGLEYGIAGVALAALVSAAIFNGVVMLVIVSRRFGMRSWAYLWDIARAHAPAVVVAGAVGVYLARGPVGDFVAAHSKIPSLLMVVAGGLEILVAYFAVFSVTGLSGDERRGAVGKLRHWRVRAAREST